MRNLRFAVRVAFYAVTVYSALSTVLIYIFLQWFNSFQIDGSATDGISNRTATGPCGGDPRSPFNVLSRDVMSKNEIALRGWWQDHSAVKTDVQCFNQPWALCSTAFSITCKPTTIHAIYQYLAFRRNVTLRSFRLSVRASAEQLESQTADSFVGAIVLVKLSDGSEEFLRVPFPATTSTLTQRDGVYTASRSDRTVSSATVMLGCYGYAGTVHFTDVVLTPLADPGSLSCRARELLEDCPPPARSPHRKLKLRHELILGKVRSPSKKRHLNKDVALVTQLSMDRLPVLEHTLQQWEGPVSLVIYAPVKAGQPEGDWQKLYVQKKLQKLKLHPDSHVSLAYGVPGSGDYPINALRNLAIRQTNCEHLFLADADFQPSPDFHKHFLLSTRSISNTDKVAFVVPAFEYLELPQKSDGVAQTKEELMQLLHRQDPFVQRFRHDVTPDSHQSTDYWKWYRTDRPYPVRMFVDMFEPYVVVKNVPQLPLYDERFTGYGSNKMTHTAELFAAGYVFFVLPDVWLVHVPHKPTSYFAHHVQDLQHRLRNRVQRFEFVGDVMRRYGVGSCK
ncbi:unnamed protein product [Ixodes pacificus]